MSQTQRPESQQDIRRNMEELDQNLSDIRKLLQSLVAERALAQRKGQFFEHKEVLILIDASCS
eukprot:CAMPEP_0172735676 /NCGR_PEP_ID=MMETSP1074-20121228/113068_1 /TAXON_ID=2916 /ORGANISM="Ceratium fusus, Strain PA161109" /LENGTH=62 /DNA_ID=CAMNT_0013564723 /DNA_START=43 /DNA_END=227 /DNA_ORIENTATION=-